LTFDQQPALGTAGTIRIYDAMDDKLVDTIDVGAPLDQQGYVFGGTPLQAYPVLVTEKNAELIAHYRDPAWVLDGWKPAAATKRLPLR
jgi:hypothetical protein